MEWYKFILAFGLLVIIPVWIFNLVEISLLYKIGFTIAGALGVYIALEYGAIGRKR
jgi:hypothetical protein